ncbi:MAG TPA: integrin alpha, partial [Verrucomicrobiae bacterium]|nr:integrin alpha [Verrucomicrobiae bacterium]
MKTIQAFAACTMALVLTVPATAATRPEPEIRGLSGILSDIQCQEYAFSAREDGALSAPNRSQDLRSRLTSAGLHLASRRNESAWSVDLRLARFGRESSTDELAPTIPGKQGSKVVFSRDGIAEWYRNDARGLEQGFDVPGRPPKDDSLGRLALEMTVRTSLQPVCGADRRSVIFRSTAGEPILRYAELKASDAGGRDLPAELTLTPQGGLRILVDDRGAHYPVTIDPIVTSPSWTMSGDESNAYVGYSVASAGDVNNDGYADVIVGAPLYDSGQTDEGKVFVLHGSSSGLVSVNWTGEGNQAGAEYGYSVASAGDVNGDGYSDIIVGAPFWESGSNQTDEGAAYIYLGSSTGLATTPNRTLEGDQAGAHFGLSVASAGHIDGDAYGDIIVGAPGYTNGETSEGRVKVWRGSSTGIPSSAHWRAESNQANAFFGSSVASAGDVNGDGYDDVL